MAWLVALPLVAELLRNTGKFTMTDVLSFRLRQKPVRLAAVSEAERVKASRITAVVLGLLGIGLGILANGQNIAFLVAPAFAVAAAANLPTIIYSLYWKRFTTRGALADRRRRREGGSPPAFPHERVWRPGSGACEPPASHSRSSSRRWPRCVSRPC